MRLFPDGLLRRFLEFCGFVGLAVVVAWSCQLGAAVPAPGSLPTRSIAPGVVLIPGVFVAGRQPDGNSIIIAGNDGLIVFDSGRHRAHTQRILDIAHADAKPIVAVVNSHWHLDHVSGNPMLRAAYPELSVYASHAIEGALSGFLAENRKQAQALLDRHAIPADQLDDVKADMASVDNGRALLPDHYVERDTEIVLAGRSVHLGLSRNAATAGDVWLLDEKTGVLLSGDLVTLPVPLFDTACASRWSGQLARLDKLDFRVLVPGHGAPMKHAALHRYRQAFDALRTCAAVARSTGFCTGQWLRDAGPLIPASDIQLARGLLGYYLTQVLRAPAQQRDRYCAA